METDVIHRNQPKTESKMETGGEWRMHLEEQIKAIPSIYSLIVLSCKKSRKYPQDQIISIIFIYIRNKNDQGLQLFGGPLRLFKII